MTILNGYATRAELLREITNSEDAQDANALDDQVMDDILSDASRVVDHFCARQFFATAETLRLDAPSPYDRSLWFGKDVLAVQGASDGNGASIGSANWYLWPRNSQQAYAAIVMKESATVSWLPASTGDYENAITIAASVGYVNRAASAASDPAAGLAIISATHRAALIKAQILYRQRFPSSVELRVQKDSDWQALVEGYVRHGY